MFGSMCKNLSVFKFLPQWLPVHIFTLNLSHLLANLSISVLLESEMETQALLAQGWHAMWLFSTPCKAFCFLHHGCNKSECSDITHSHAKKKKIHTAFSVNMLTDRMPMWEEVHWRYFNHSSVNGMPGKACPSVTEILPSCRRSITSFPHWIGWNWRLAQSLDSYANDLILRFALGKSIS